MRMKIKAAIELLGMAAVVAATVMVSAEGASAAKPLTFSFESTDALTDTSLCGFPIEVATDAVIVNTEFSDIEDGNGRETLHAVEHDTFTANGTTLVGDRYHYYVSVTYVDFEPVSYTASGHLEKVHLPDGSIFMGAGRIDLLATTLDLPWAPDHGAAKNLDAFCAALSA